MWKWPYTVHTVYCTASSRDVLGCTSSSTSIFQSVLRASRNLLVFGDVQPIYIPPLGFGHTEMFDLLLDKGKVNIEDTEPLVNTVLKVARARHAMKVDGQGNTRKVALLLSKGRRTHRV